MDERNRNQNKKHGYALITGASSGIGREFAIQLARRGYPLILVARREKRLSRLAEKLQERYGTQSLVLAADLSSTEACQNLFEQIGDRELAIVINNAGFGDCSRFEDGDVDKELAMIDVNVKAMHLILKLSLQKMLQQRHMYGNILNVASSAGLLPAGPYMATYYATKAYVASLTQAVAQEQDEAGTGIYVGCLCPGPVETEFDDVANVHFSLPGITARECVACAIRGMEWGQTVIVPGKMMKAGIFGSRFVPRKMLIRMTGAQQKRKLQKVL